MSEQPAAGPWVRLEDAPWAKDGHSILGDWGGSPVVAYWDATNALWSLREAKYITQETDPDRVAKINMEGAKG